MKNKLLIVSYHFPPILSAGVSRLKGITKYLSLKGWDISVFTVKRSYSERSDVKDLQWVHEGMTVIRSESFEIDRFNPRNFLYTSGIDEETGGPGRRSGASYRILELLRFPYAIVHKTFSYPDRQVGWAVPLCWALSKALRSGERPLVLSSSPPHSSHLPIMLLKIFFRFRWVVDFRDPWTVPPYYYRTKLSMSLARQLERMVLKRCDRIIANTRGNREALLEAFPFLVEDKIDIVTNGFDTDDTLNAFKPTDNHLDCDLLFTGEVYSGMLDTYIEAISILMRKGGSLIPRLAVYGNMDSSYLDILENSPVGKYISFLGRVSYQKSLSLMKTAKSLLLILPHSERGKTWVPSKIYPYIFSGRPVLALAPEGDATGLIEDTGSGVTIKAGDAETVAGALVQFVQSLGTGSFSARRNEEQIEKYTMKSIAAEMERILKEEAEAVDETAR